jgi:hypothetical protein
VKWFASTGKERYSELPEPAVLIRLNTRGGMLDSARQIVQKFVLLPRLFQPVSNHLYGDGMHEIGHIDGEEAWLRVEARVIQER